MSRATTTSFRLPPELRAQLEQASAVLHRGKNWIIVHALQDYLAKIDDAAFIREAQRQSILASQQRTDEEKEWEKNSDLRDWED